MWIMEKGNMLEEMEEDFGIANVVHDSRSNAILPGETKEEYQDGKKKMKKL